MVMMIDEEDDDEDDEDDEDDDIDYDDDSSLWIFIGLRRKLAFIKEVKPHIAFTHHHNLSEYR